MSDLDPTAPRKVIKWAREHGGLHNDCLVAIDPCGACERTLMAAMDHFYGHHSGQLEALLAIISDFRDDLIEDEQRGTTS